jgi:hypothetical protein
MGGIGGAKMNRRYQTPANKIGEKALFSVSPAILGSLSYQSVFQITPGQNRVWRDKPVNVLAANCLIFPAKRGNPI